MLLVGQAGVIVTLVLLGICPLFYRTPCVSIYRIIFNCNIFSLYARRNRTSNLAHVIRDIPTKGSWLWHGCQRLFLWMANFTVSLVFPILLGHLGLSNTFIIFALLNIMSIIFVKIFLPETKGKSLEEIEDYFKSQITTKSQRTKKLQKNPNYNRRS